MSFFSVIFIVSSIALVLRALFFTFRAPKKLDLKRNAHARDFHIANAGASLRTSIFMTSSWMVITTGLIKDSDSWSGFLGTRETLEVIAVLSLFLCHMGCVGVYSGRIKAFNEGETFSLKEMANWRVNLICLAGVVAYIGGFLLHIEKFYPSLIH